ncbi:MAG: PIG-L family deacetylase [Candidatus Promineifilaceae bacterium]|nr:PIG-L family deacetylase [Candidatus Promineifilaceae bacterium]
MLSPHLDDAALSCGGQIYLKTSAGLSVLIVSVMAGDPPQPALSEYAKSLHNRWQIAGHEAEQRRQEDARAARILRADYLHLDIPDCIYRRDPRSDSPYYTSDREIFGKIAPADAVMIRKISELLENLPQFGHIYVPLGVGNHVDHQLTRLAAEQIFGGQQVVYYDEYPYADQPGAVGKAFGADLPKWTSQVIIIPEAALAAKIMAIAAYTSQLSTFFLDLEDLDRRVRQYTQTIGGERIWHKCYHEGY